MIGTHRLPWICHAMTGPEASAGNGIGRAFEARRNAIAATTRLAFIGRCLHR
jgi:hypothetical protein